MGTLPGGSRMRVAGPLALAVLALGAAGSAAYLYWHKPAPAEEPPVLRAQYASHIQLQFFCTRCHAYPPVETFPRAAWKHEVEQAYAFFHESGLPMQAPPMQDVIAYFERYAPEELPPAEIVRATHPLPIPFERLPHPAPTPVATPAVANVNLVHLFDERRLDVLACDLRAGLVMALRPYEPSTAWRTLGRVPHPAHAEVVDLDGDGVKDILVANLGSVEPTDARTGSVVWLRGGKDGQFTPVTLLEGVGRVADVQAADFRGVGKLDLVVAVFGWRKTGEILYLENRTTDWSRPVFEPRVLDVRHGAIHVPVGDLNGDGKPDIVALLSQEHETLVAFLNDGKGQFRKETIYAAPHPGYGSSGIQLVDLNGDGKSDVLYTNGDTMDKPHVLKPYHGIQWLENQGRFPFAHHPIAPMYGVCRAVAADFRGTGKPDIVAVSWLPEHAFPQRQSPGLDAVIYLEQTSPGRFARHTLESVTCDHPTCAAGDLFGTGKADFVTGHLASRPGQPAVTVWKNAGSRR